MKLNLRDVLLVTVAGLSAACASTERARRAEERSTKFSRSLRVDMPIQEVRALGETVANCRGQPQGLMTCEVVVDLESTRSVPHTPLAARESARPSGISDLYDRKTTRTYDIYSLDFEGEKLKRWTRRSEVDAGSQ